VHSVDIGRCKIILYNMEAQTKVACVRSAALWLKEELFLNALQIVDT
jgi:hypothetical protein